MELYKKYRPQTVADVVGQPEAVKVVSGWIKADNIPHAILFEGPSGVGKTTLARCLARELGAEGVLNYREMNVAVERGVSMVEDLVEDVANNLTDGNRVWVLDEMQSLTLPAKNSLLKVLEECPSYAYFIFCTTDTSKIIKPLMNRCSRVSLKAIKTSSLEGLIRSVAEKEGVTVPDNIVSTIASKADGSARGALVLLEQALTVTQPEDMLAIVNNSDNIDIGNAGLRAFWSTLFSPKPHPWKLVADELEKLTDTPETIRRTTLAALDTKLRKHTGAGLSIAKVADMIRIFQFGLDDSGKPGLTLMVYDAWVRMHGQ